MSFAPASFHILIAEDDPHIVDILDYALRAQGYAVRSTARGAEAIALCAQTPAPDLLILDVGLPDIDGFEVCRQVRRFSERLPILFLTSQGDEINRVVGLEIGGDDYVTKPFSPRELVARIKTWRRRLTANAELAKPPAAQAAAPVLRYGPLEIDEERFQARCAGSPIILTRQEFRLLTLLAGSPGRVFTREQVLDRAWEDGGAVTDRTIDAHIKSLRRKLSDAGGGSGGEGLIETVRGVGYRARETP
jgi:DNA-binding response OmpR family regulator